MAKKATQLVANESNTAPEDVSQVDKGINETNGTDAGREGTLLDSSPKESSISESAESVTEGATIQETLVENETGLVEILEGYDDGYVRIKIPVTTVDISNRNGRTYPRALAIAESNMVFEGQILGQSKHPEHEPDLLDQFIVWEKSVLENDLQSFIAKIIPTQKGKDFVEITRAKARVATSRRGAGELEEGKDKLGAKTKVVIPEKYTLHGIDIIYPGFQSDRGAQKTIHFESVQPNTESNIVETPMPENETANQVVEDVVEAAAVAQAAKPADTAKDTTPPVVQEQKETTPAVAQAVQTERASVTATTPQNAPVPSEVIEKLTADIQAKQTLITTLNVKIVDLASDNAVKTEQVKAMTEAITGLNAETTRLSKAISEMNDAVQDRTKLISERDATLTKRNQTLADRQALLVQAHKTIQERDDAIAERNKHITHKNGLLAVRDETIAKQQKEISERNQTIAKQDLEIASQDATIQERNQAIAAERQSLAERDSIIAQSDKELMERNAELLAMQEQLLTEKVNVEAEKQRNAAFQHLFEKVQIEGEKASWFIFNDLRECATVAEVEAKFAASKARGIQLIEGVARVAGRAVYEAATALTDADELDTNGKPKIKQSPKETQTNEVDAEFAKKANKVAYNFGL